MLTLFLNDESTFNIDVENNPISQYIEKSFRHLQHLPIPFHIYDYIKRHITDKDLLYTNLINSAAHLGIKVETRQLGDQKYLNELHKIYEFGYNKGSNVWLEFHEMIHFIESLNNMNQRMIKDQFEINYRDQAGPLEKPFDRTYLKHSTHTIDKGTCYCHWSELGKTPYQYWMDNEPDDIARICTLAKPWTMLRPSFTIALEDIDFKLSQKQEQEFNKWFSKYKKQWLEYWKLDSWSEHEMNAVIPIGKISNIDLLKNKMHSCATPTYIKVSEE